MKKNMFVVLIAALVVLGIAPNTGSGQSSKKGFLGVVSTDLSQKVIKKYNLPVDHGAYISSVVDGSAADEAGIEPKDVIVKFGDETIYDDDDLTSAIRSTKPYTEVKIELYRKGEKKTLTAKVDKLKSYNYSYSSSSDSWGWLGDLFSHHHYDELDARNTGVKSQDLTRQLGEYFGVPGGRGVLLTEIRRGGVVDKAGFKAGDVVTKIDDHGIDDLGEMLEVIRDHEGKNVVVEVMRSGKPMNLNIRIPDENDDWY
jgi:serine protease Do